MGREACIWMVCHAPTQRGGGPIAPQFGGFYLCIHPLTQNYQISHGNTWGGGFLDRWSHQRDGVPALHNFWVLQSRIQQWAWAPCHACTLCRRSTKFHVVTRGGVTSILGSATPPIPREWEFKRFSIFVFSCNYAIIL